jgi:hypothetical protein
MDMFLREVAEALVERIADRFGRSVAWIAVIIMILLLTVGAILIGALIFT